MRVVVCGAGVIGATLAYYLSRRGAKPIVVERIGVACAASGKSGGFIALDWCDGTPLQHMARRSFALHATLTEELGEDYGYRRLTTFSGRAGASPRRRALGRHPEWLSEEVILDGCLGTAETTAQVDPGRFTAALMRAAQTMGAELRIGEVQDLAAKGGGNAVALRVDGEEIEGDAVVIAMGPWSMRGARWLPLPAVYGSKGHSMVFQTGGKIGAEALFLEIQDEAGSLLSPEIVPRADGTTWACAVSSGSPLPVDPALVAPDPGAMERLHALCRRISPVLAASPVLHEQACFRPVTQDGLPLVGAVSGLPGAYVATGHSVWGILNAPATGEALADLILDGQAGSIDLSPFDPARLPPIS